MNDRPPGAVDGLLARVSTLRDGVDSMVDRGQDNLWRLGVVSYLNAKPLIVGLDHDPGVEMAFDVPARLPAMLDQRDVDVALVPVVDLFAPGRNWSIISNACIACNGETLTVRVFSRGPAEKIRRLHVDGDSHTSVVLARVIWKEMYGVDLDVLPWHGREKDPDCEAVLLIGDKVVSHSLVDLDQETDLGSAWKSLTSLPFVFAVWAAPADLDTGDLADRLAQARDAGVRSAELIAEDFGPGQGFPVAIAKRYLTARLKFTMTERYRDGLRRFMELALKHGLIAPQRELTFA